MMAYTLEGKVHPPCSKFYCFHQRYPAKISASGFYKQRKPDCKINSLNNKKKKTRSVTSSNKVKKSDVAQVFPNQYNDHVNNYSINEILVNL